MAWPLLRSLKLLCLEMQKGKDLGGARKEKENQSWRISISPILSAILKQSEIVYSRWAHAL